MPRTASITVLSLVGLLLVSAGERTQLESTILSVVTVALVLVAGWVLLLHWRAHGSSGSRSERNARRSEIAAIVVCVLTLGAITLAFNFGNDDAKPTADEEPSTASSNASQLAAALANAPTAGVGPVDETPPGPGYQTSEEKVVRAQLEAALDKSGRLLGQRKFDQAIPTFRELIEDAREAQDLKIGLRATTGLAEALLNTEKKDAAMAALDEGLAWADEVVPKDARPPADELRVAAIRSAVLLSDNKAAEALAELEATLEAAVAEYPADLTLRGLITDQLARASLALGRNEVGLDAIRAHVLALGSANDPPLLAEWLDKLGRFHGSIEQYDESVKAFSQSIEQREKTGAGDSVPGHITRVNLAVSLWKSGQKAKARQTIETAAEALANQLPADHPARINAAKLAADYGVKIE